jgi:hypothetical protein
MADTEAASPPVAAGVTQITVRAASTASSAGFHDVLSELNPLQYIPIIGTIYRAATGDVIPESSRSVGSLVVSFLTGGPIGVATNVAAETLEKVTGIDPETIGQTLLADIGVFHHTASHAARVPATAMAATPPPAAHAWSVAQLSAYGVTTVDGTLRRGTVEGSDVLNDLELARHASADEYKPAFTPSDILPPLRTGE